MVITVKIAKRIPQCIAEFAVRINDARQDLVRAANVLGIIDSGGPEPENFGAGFVDYLLRGGNVPKRFRLLFTLTVHNPAVSDYLFIRRPVMSDDAAPQAGIEPAAILVAAFEIDVGRKAQSLSSCFQYSNAA